jgi:hypothetical protein
MKPTDDGAHIDGNSLSGPLAAVFAFDVTTAVATCAGCGRSNGIADAMVYGVPMGHIARCPGCGDALLRFADTPAGSTLDMRGIAALRLTPTREP